ncbi:MAG: ABC transporter permease [Nitrososphaerales archaeon]
MDFIKRRILTYLVVLFVVLNLDFFLPRIAPGNPALQYTSNGLNSNLQQQLVTARFGLNQPLYVQYYSFLKNIFATWPPNFGISYQYYPQTVWNLFVSRIGWTALLIVSSIVLSVILAYFMARRSCMNLGGKADTGFLYSAISFQTIPIYWVAMILLWYLGFELKWFPTFGNVDANITSTGLDYWFSVIYHAILPLTVMTLSVFGQNYLILRGSIQEVLKSDFVTTAKTRGLSNGVIASSYILRSSLLPLVSVLSFSVASLISRDVLVEAVFGYNGVGDLLVDGVVNRDFPVLEGTLFLLTVIILIGGLVGDLILVKLDPRLRR